MPVFNYKTMNLFYEIAGNGSETIAMVHGLGSSSRTFAKINEYPWFQNYRLLAIDLLGFGLSDKPRSFDYGMASQAGACVSLFQYLGITETLLIGHSMGGVICQFIAERFPVIKFVNCEGNLILDDCSLSVEIARRGLSEFETKGFAGLKEEAEGTPFYDDYCRTTAFAMYCSAGQLVESCRNDNLLERFAGLPVPRLYVYGARTRGKRKSEQYLIDNGMMIKYIPDSGHNMITGNPDGFYRAVAEFFA